MRRATEICRHHWCNGRAVVGASEGISERFFATQMGASGSVLSQRRNFLRAGWILPLWARDDSRRQRYNWWNSRASVGTREPVFARILDALKCVRRWFLEFSHRFFTSERIWTRDDTGDEGMTGLTLEPRAARVDSFLHKFLTLRWYALGHSAPILKEAIKIWPLWMRVGHAVRRHEWCDGRRAVVSCGGLSGPFWVRFRVRGTGFLSRLKVKKVARVKFCRYAPQVARGATASPL